MFRLVRSPDLADRAPTATSLSDVILGRPLASQEVEKEELSYRQTQAAYPNGGGAYLVAKDNLGLWAGVALLLDYLLNVAVAISAGVGAVVSAIPALYPHTLSLCLIVLFTLLIVNLRGVRESGLTFVLPVFIFIA